MYVVNWELALQICAKNVIYSVCTEDSWAKEQEFYKFSLDKMGSHEGQAGLHFPLWPRMTLS